MNLFEQAFTSTLKTSIAGEVEIRLTNNRRAMISVKRTPGMMFVRVARYFALADRDVTEGLVAYINNEIKKPPPCVMRFAESHRSPDTLIKQEKRRANPKGKVYNLKEITDDLDRSCFNGELKAVIGWRNSRVVKGLRFKTRRVTLGFYDGSLDLIMINSVLDNRLVPIEYLRLVVYHEMLHKYLGVKTSPTGRRMAHTPEFRRLERSFEGFGDLIKWEKRNLHKLLSG